MKKRAAGWDMHKRLANDLPETELFSHLSTLYVRKIISWKGGEVVSTAIPQNCGRGSSCDLEADQGMMPLGSC
jgi:hypothetical protein